MSTEPEKQPQPKQVPLVALTPALWNPRSIKDEHFQNLCRSLEEDPEFLQLRPILATADGTIFAGNMRYRAAQQLGWETIPAILVDIPEALAKERALRDNAQWGEWLEEDLAALLGELGAAGSDLDLLGFPATWKGAVENLTAQMRRALETRWRGVLAFEEAFALGSAAFGHDIVHARMRVAVVALRAKVLDLHQAMQLFEAFHLPVLTPEEHQEASDYFDLAALRGAGGAQGPRERLHVTTGEKLDAEEAKLATDLRAEEEGS